jgi:hypothetical protein
MYMKRKLFALFCFGIAFAFVEAVVVVYLRKLLGLSTMGIVTPKNSPVFNIGFMAFVPLPASVFGTSRLMQIEIFREAATIIMLAAVAYLAADKIRARIGAFLIAFSLWDFFYYVFLYFLIGWPKSLFDMDIYFLIPIAWIGPVITPMVISIILLAAGVIMVSL